MSDIRPLHPAGYAFLVLLFLVGVCTMLYGVRMGLTDHNPRCQPGTYLSTSSNICTPYDTGAPTP